MCVAQTGLCLMSEWHWALASAGRLAQSRDEALNGRDALPAVLALPSDLSELVSQVAVALKTRPSICKVSFSSVTT